MARTLEYNATLVAREDLSKYLAVFKVEPDTPIPEGRWFVPGQYLTLGLNNEAQPELGSVRRAMSIASAPQQRGTIDFYIRYVNHPESDNPLTHLLWQMKPGDRMCMTTRAVGKFTLDDTVAADDPRLKIFVAAGTGLAPFTSIVDADLAADPKARLDRYVLLHGASYPNELGYREHLERVAREHGLHYLPTVSRPHEAPEWTGYGGRVEDFFAADRIEQTERAIGVEPGSLGPDSAVIYICGLTGTIAMTIERTLARGFVPFHRKIRRALGFDDGLESTIYYEQYDSEPVLRVRDPDELTRLKALLPPAPLPPLA
ncbi:ferredoxin--NADP reductase [Pseudenhygromyxa sp. WMMC2535]|uniref:ferredoxin--NADP reductase n=1 Tax=Pseudenhygromyxa sp. WMMC2535 TaxID=2712867 RepID=UPI00155529F5|nr:ferredoxin--NADP reductase [Pseudenhygromyxa sp. WMMC2535]NVB42315.1 ferredoxin--NADP reductase [Pseudenhygromyxa sp. WMMC2535]